MVELTGDDLSMFSNFERITHVMPSDYLASESSIIFLVSQESLGKAIGKHASNIEKLKQIFRKRVIVVADSKDMEVFVRNFFGNVSITDIEIRDVMGEKAIMLTIDEKDRGIAIGRDGERIKAAKTLLKKKFNATVHLRTRRTAF
ncbi:NusA-like transcription termination signal-binding factor [Candidatus Micrarchaeota archaeon]|nr:NusA-like transcription termination signal-binding factor [Candidatus Micrarchaeota archaeon]